MRRRRKKRYSGKCQAGCGRRIHNVSGVCLPCIGGPGVAPRPGELVEAFCEWCGRVHALRKVCEVRAERAAEAVRLWLHEGIRPGSAESGVAL